VEFDRVERKNLVRQYVYRDRDIGRPKVERAAEWIGEFNPGIQVRAVDTRITERADIEALLVDADLVFGTVDQPAEAVQWVNDACVSHGVPHVSMGVQARSIRYWSVDPGRSACFSCALASEEDSGGPGGAPWARRLLFAQDLVNPATGPLVSLVMGFAAMEALRYLTGFAEPVAAGIMNTIDVATGTRTAQVWNRREHCDVCASAPPAADRTAGAPRGDRLKTVHA
jgi:molybdopterin-synthase adenylyltransferase